MTDFNLEQELKKSRLICKKVRNDNYAQNLYAALCNMQWQKLEVLPILKEELWSCSWRYAGGLVAELRGNGDYIDWYCSGMWDNGKSEIEGYVSESTVTEEIAADLRQLGWIPVPYDE